MSSGGSQLVQPSAGVPSVLAEGLYGPADLRPERYAEYRALVASLHEDVDVLIGHRTVQAVNIERFAYTYVKLRQVESAPVIPYPERNFLSKSLGDWNDSLYAWYRSSVADNESRAQYAQALGPVLSVKLEALYGRGKPIKNRKDLEVIVAAIREAVTEVLG